MGSAMLLKRIESLDQIKISADVIAAEDLAGPMPRYLSCYVF